MLVVTEAENFYKKGLEFYNTAKFLDAQGYFHRAVNGNLPYPPAYLQLAIMYRNGSIPKDEKRRDKYKKLAADAKDWFLADTSAFGEYHLGLCYACGIGFDKNETLSVKYYTSAAEQGVAQARLNLGFCYENGIGVAKDVNAAFKYFKLAAEQGSVQAQAKLGFFYENGIGVAKDVNAAFKYFELAADQGMRFAQFKVGLCYENEIGVAKYRAGAADYYKLAADQGLLEAQCKLALCYQNGTGVEKNIALAVTYYKLAADQSSLDTQYLLGEWYREGKFVAEDKKQAFKYYKLAADGGHKDAQCCVGYCYDAGFGVDANKRLAFDNYKSACNSFGCYFNVSQTNNERLSSARGRLGNMEFADTWIDWAADMCIKEAKGEKVELYSFERDFLKERGCQEEIFVKIKEKLAKDDSIKIPSKILQNVNNPESVTVAIIFKPYSYSFLNSHNEAVKKYFNSFVFEDGVSLDNLKQKNP